MNVYLIFLMLFSLMAHPLLHIEDNTVDLVLCTRLCYICIKLNSSEISAFVKVDLTLHNT